MSTEVQQDTGLEAYTVETHRVVADRVRALFKIAGITQDQAAAKLGIKPETLGKALHRKGGLRTHLPRIAAYFGVPIWTMTGAEKAFSIATEKAEQMDRPELQSIDLPAGCRLVQLREGGWLLLGPVGWRVSSGSVVVFEADGERVERTVELDEETGNLALMGGPKPKIYAKGQAPELRIKVARCAAVGV